MSGAARRAHAPAASHRYRQSDPAGILLAFGQASALMRPASRPVLACRGQLQDLAKTLPKTAVRHGGGGAGGAAAPEAESLEDTAAPEGPEAADVDEDVEFAAAEMLHLGAGLEPPPQQEGSGDGGAAMELEAKLTDAQEEEVQKGAQWSSGDASRGSGSRSSGGYRGEGSGDDDDWQADGEQQPSKRRRKSLLGSRVQQQEQAPSAAPASASPPGGAAAAPGCAVATPARPLAPPSSMALESPMGGSAGLAMGGSSARFVGVQRASGSKAHVARSWIPRPTGKPAPPAVLDMYCLGCERAGCPLSNPLPWPSAAVRLLGEDGSPMSKQLTLCYCGSDDQAAVARDLAIVWSERGRRQAQARLNFPELFEQKEVMARLAAVAATDSLQRLVKELRDSGELRRLAVLLQSRVPPAAAAADGRSTGAAVEAAEPGYGADAAEGVAAGVAYMP